jgi:hypothetical protein
MKNYNKMDDNNNNNNEEMAVLQMRRRHNINGRTNRRNGVSSMCGRYHV